MDTFTTDTTHHSVVGIIVKVMLAVAVALLVVLGLRTYRKLKEKGDKPTIQTVKDAATAVGKETVDAIAGKVKAS
jgi:hypothetical protein